MTKDYLEAFETIYNNIDYLISDVGIENDDVNICLKTIKEQLPTIKQSLHRLESIDNTEPSEALKKLEMLSDCAEAMKEKPSSNWIEYADNETELDYQLWRAYEDLKSALLKAQEPKKYLKWEDLEFNHTPKMIDVKMNGNKYKLVVGYNVAGKNLAILRDGKNEYYFLEYDKQFFNDLHLERAEE